MRREKGMDGGRDAAVLSRKIKRKEVSLAAAGE